MPNASSSCWWRSPAASGRSGRAGEVKEGETRRFDERVLLALRESADRADPWAGLVEESERDFTALGGVAVMSPLTCGVVGFLLLDRKNRAALLVLAAVGGGLLQLVLKHHSAPSAGPRPARRLRLHLSFRNRLRRLAAATYLTLGALLARVQAKGRIRSSCSASPS